MLQNDWSKNKYFKRKIVLYHCRASNEFQVSGMFPLIKFNNAIKAIGCTAHSNEPLTMVRPLLRAVIIRGLTIYCVSIHPQRGSLGITTRPWFCILRVINTMLFRPKTDLWRTRRSRVKCML